MTYYKAVVIKTLWCWYHVGQIKQENKEPSKGPIYTWEHENIAIVNH